MDNKQNKTASVRAMHIMAILTLVLSLTTVAYASPASPFTGQWQAIDLSGHISITGSAILANTSPGDGDAILMGDYRPYATTANGSCIAGNGDTAVYNGGEEYTQDFTGNWWGDASGPGGEGPGSGNSVHGLVDFSGWLTAPPAICAP